MLIGNSRWLPTLFPRATVFSFIVLPIAQPHHTDMYSSRTPRMILDGITWNNLKSRIDTIKIEVRMRCQFDFTPRPRPIISDESPVAVVLMLQRNIGGFAEVEIPRLCANWAYLPVRCQSVIMKVDGILRATTIALWSWQAVGIPTEVSPRSNFW